VFFEGYLILLVGSVLWLSECLQRVRERRKLNTEPFSQIRSVATATQATTATLDVEKGTSPLNIQPLSLTYDNAVAGINRSNSTVSASSPAGVRTDMELRKALSIGNFKSVKNRALQSVKNPSIEFAVKSRSFSPLGGSPVERLYTPIPAALPLPLPLPLPLSATTSANDPSLQSHPNNNNNSNLMFSSHFDHVLKIEASLPHIFRSITFSDKMAFEVKKFHK